MVGGFKKYIVNFVVKYIKKMVFSYLLLNVIKFVDVLVGNEVIYKKFDVDLNDLVFL